MKITRYTHSCLLVESDDAVALFDPGNYAWQSGLFNLDSLQRLDLIAITHEHDDHCFLPFIEAVVKKFPEVKIISTDEVVKKLAVSNIKAQSTAEGNVAFFESHHESMAPLMPDPICQNVGIHYKGQLTHPGDSHSFKETKDILALPVAAPWGAMIDGVRLAVKLSPKVIIPIHDGFISPEARAANYDRLEGFFSSMNIRFIKPIDGEPFEV